MLQTLAGSLYKDFRIAWTESRLSTGLLVSWASLSHIQLHNRLKLKMCGLVQVMSWSVRTTRLTNAALKIL